MSHMNDSPGSVTEPPQGRFALPPQNNVQQPALVDLNFNKLILQEIISSVISLYDEQSSSYNPTNQLLNFHSLPQETKTNVITNLKTIGCSTGEKLSMDFNSSSTMTQLQVMKYICKDIYHNIIGRQMDALKTNHQGIFYLLDKQFLANSNISFDKSLQKYRSNDIEEQAKCLELFPTFIAAVMEGFLNKPVSFSIEKDVITYIIKY